MYWLDKFKQGKMISILSIFFLLSSCSSSEKIVPSVEVPEKWSYQGIPSTISLPELAWWKQFNDPQLDTLMVEALARNNDIQIASANLEQAQNQLKQVKLNWIPGLTVIGGYSQMPNLGEPGYFWGLFPLYAINAFQQIKQQKAATYQVETQKYAQESVRLAIIGQVAASYFNVLAYKEDLDLYQNRLQQQKTLLRLYETQYSTGIISEDKLDNTRRDMQATFSQMKMAQHNIRVAENALRFLMNQNPVPTGYNFTNRTFDEINSNTLIPGDLPVTVLSNRPDVHQAESALKASYANIEATQARLLPSVRLDAWVGNTSLDGDLSLGEAYVTVPALDPNTLGAIKISQSQYKVLYATYLKVIQQVLRDIENDFSAYRTYSTQLTDTKAALAQENNICKLTHSRYIHGIDSEVEVAECKLRQTQIELTASHTKLEKMMTIVALYQDLGGGYRASH